LASTTYFYGGGLRIIAYLFLLGLLVFWQIRRAVTLFLLDLCGAARAEPELISMISNCFFNTFDYIKPRFISIRPLSNWFSILGKRLKLT